jgi:hypothetical protein
MAQEVLFYHSGMAGAPSATLNTAGAIITLLDAVLVNGFNVVGISSLTSSAGTATATTAAAHNFAVGDWVDVSGADQAAYNGRVQVLTKPATNQFTYSVTGSPASPATGSMSAKHGALGWTKPYTGTNGAVYKPTGSATDIAIQIEDNNVYADSNLSFRARQILTPSGFPDVGLQLGEQDRQQKSSSGWIVAGDAKTFYLFMTASGSTNSFVCGEVASYLAGDQFHFFNSRGDTAGSSSQYSHDFTQYNATFVGRYAPTALRGAVQGSMTFLRGIQQLGAHVLADPILPCTSGAQSGSSNANTAGSQTLQLPNIADNAVPLLPIFVQEQSSSAYHLRGRVRGMYFPLGKFSSSMFANNFFRLDDVLIEDVVRKVAIVPVGPLNSNQVAIDLGTSWG